LNADEADRADGSGSERNKKVDIRSAQIRLIRLIRVQKELTHENHKKDVMNNLSRPY
jgi:hypothetical protein